jgi:cation transport regulator ChaC
VCRYYFAYGSNMNPERVAQRGLRFDEVCNAAMDDVRLTFDKQSREHPHCGHANLTFARGARTEGVLYRLDSSREIERMDRFETAPINYSRDVVWVRTADGMLPAWTYFANAAVVRTGLRPERTYLNHLLAGRSYLSDAYFDWLSGVPCVDD